jgi:hypothetical protein
MVTLQKMFTFSLNGYTIAGVNTIKNKNFWYLFSELQFQTYYSPFFALLSKTETKFSFRYE